MWISFEIQGTMGASALLMTRTFGGGLSLPIGRMCGRLAGCLPLRSDEIIRKCDGIQVSDTTATMEDGKIVLTVITPDEVDTATLKDTKINMGETSYAITDVSADKQSYHTGVSELFSFVKVGFPENILSWLGGSIIGALETLPDRSLSKEVRTVMQALFFLVFNSGRGVLFPSCPVLAIRQHRRRRAERERAILGARFHCVLFGIFELVIRRLWFLFCR